MARTPRFRLTAPVPPEQDLHVAVYHALRVLLPSRAVINSWDLANARDAIEGARKKAKGCRAGWPDMGVWWNRRVVLLELKREVGGTLSPAQKEVHEQLAENGFPVTVCRSVDDALDAVVAAGMPLHGRISA